MHFVAVATVVFVVHSLWVGGQAADDRTIYVPAGELERLGTLYQAEAGALPGQIEARGLVADYVRREALSREARRLGLDLGDIVVDRRLEQKMAFMVADLVDLPEPDEAILEVWFANNAETFELPARVSFDHVYFRDTEDPRIASARQSLSTAEGDEWSRIGDPFMLEPQFDALSVQDVARLFGRDFADSLLAFVPGANWQGPVRSALGVHFVRLTARSDVRRPEFHEVRADVLVDWQEAERQRLNEAAIQSIIDGYTVIIGAD